VSGARRTVGVMGGMGPAATVDFLDRVRRATPAARDQDHLRLLVDNDPSIPDRNAALAGRGPSPGPALAAMARGLERAGADGLVMVCNSAHAWAAEVRAAASVPLIDMVGETAAEVADGGARRAGLLAADACLGAGLYQAALARRGVEAQTLPPEAQARFMALLYAIKAGEVGPDARAAMRELAEALVAAGADTLVGACTEVPLVLGADEASRPLVDATAVLVARTIAFGRGAWTPD
jgi:aspartate racemase